MKPIFIALASLIITFSCKAPQEEVNTSFPLKEYVYAIDEAFRYEITETIKGGNWTEYRIKMVSGTWLTEEEVDHPEWWHWLTMVVPENVLESESMMYISGGSTKDTLPGPTEASLIKAAVATGSIVSSISNIPFQPTTFKGDQMGGRYEDELIAYGWLQFLESGASSDKSEWLARYPMTRAVVRAMDVVQEVSRNIQKPVQEFFVTGASKRGWTTWTTAAVDDRVIGIAPMVIDLLNIVPSFQHHWQCYGEWSPAVEDYVNEGIMNWLPREEFRALLDLVGPYSFVDQLTIPKLLINGTSDEFFVTDSWKFYWDSLKGDSYLQYVPNGNHGLRGSYLPDNLVSFYHFVITGSEIPEFKWNISHDTIYLEVDQQADYEIRKWEAINATDRDFRIYVLGEAWESEEISRREDGDYAIHISKPASGYKGGVVELTFYPDSDFPLTFTSGTVITPDLYPFGPFIPEESQ
jgi:PhoPQ-activated pathogenicity-related protein